ncbi:MAG: phosphoribosylaminoimidazolesuccinocarboxamide synthase [Candidatus Dadabacteria bacterium]|nr:MAG: phosphoribosylaminoimidazolesuccinocarboxamide synthase [Candidatus Dadabacteria bacterium]
MHRYRTTTRSVTRDDIIKQIPYALKETHLEDMGIGKRFQGKVRDNYTSDKRRIMIATDRLSCFDVVVAAIPFKGETLNRTTLFWFDQTKDIIQNHILDSPHPNVLIAKNCKPLPVEVIVRGYLAGSAFRDYSAGKSISGVKLPAGLKEFQRLDEPIVTPSTKADSGEHDLPISEEEIIREGLVPKKRWEEIRETALELYKKGVEIARKHGLILADTKYEFGLDGDKTILIDEIHTMDSSRYWIANTYNDLIAQGKPPEMLDKEPTRRWLIEQGYMGEGEIPEFTEDHIACIALHYISSYELITGETFSPSFDNNIEQSIRDSLSAVLKDVV